MVNLLSDDESPSSSKCNGSNVHPQTAEPARERTRDVTSRESSVSRSASHLSGSVDLHMAEKRSEERREDMGVEDMEW